MAARECACCGTELKSSWHPDGGKDFCDYGCAASYRLHDSKPVDQWPPGDECH